MAQAAIKPQELSVEVCNQTSHVAQQRHKDITFVAAGKMVEDTLRRYGFNGSFKMYPREALKGSHHLQKRGLIFARLNELQAHGVFVKVQPNGNRSAWSYNLVPPHGFSAKDFWDKLQSALVFSKEDAKDEDSPSDFESTTESFAGEPEVVQVEAFTPEMFLNDDTLVSVFVTENSSGVRCMTFQEYMECFCEDPDCSHWTIHQRQQAVQGMINKGYLIEVRGKKDTFAPCEKRFPQFKRPIAPAKAAEAPKPAAPAPEIMVVSQHQPPQKVETRLRAAAPAPQRQTPQLVIAEKPANVPVGGNLVDTIHALEAKAATFAAAQQAGTSDDRRRASLVTKLDQARAMVTALETEIQAIDESRAQNLQVLMNSEYSDAATQLARIKDMLGIS